jgi:lipid II:glycine glycyltransferase (peptidoglycan interpeptide bridge formation enzyme)
LVETPQQCAALLTAVREQSERSRFEYVELRPLNSDLPLELGYVESSKFYIHKLYLAPTLEEIFRAFHKSSVQRKIQRAEREGLTYEDGRSELLLRQFYRLLLLTRRRHGLPPQPWAWFRHLTQAMGDRLKIRLAFCGRVPIAGILTLAHRKTMFYKYGASDDQFHNLGAVQMLFWRTIQEAKAAGYGELDLGRSDLADEGLITFKDRLGSARSPLTYFRYPPAARTQRASFGVRIGSRICRHLPLSLLPAVGRTVYRHLG